MVRVIILGHGMVANHLIVGLERIKLGEIPPYGVPLADEEFGISIEDIDIVASYDIDKNKVGKSAYEVSKKSIGEMVPIPRSLKDLIISRGVHLRSVEGLPIDVDSLDSKYDTLNDIINHLVDEWGEYSPDVIINLLTTEYGDPFNDTEILEMSIEKNLKERLTASQLYAYAGSVYANNYKPITFVNVIPIFLANDPAFVELYSKNSSLILGDDGATGATPLTADLLEHMSERNRFVKFVVQFNIGGNMDFLALTIPEKNKMKEATKSSIVKDILGYDVPNFIKPTGFVETLGDKKYVALHLEYLSFNGMKDELYVNYRINDSPSLAGMLVDLIRVGKWALERRYIGTLYPVNAFFMKKPGPIDAKSVSKIKAYYMLLELLGLKKFSSTNVREKDVSVE